MIIEHIISTMNRDDASFLEKMNLRLNGLVVNQNREHNYQETNTTTGLKYNIISTPEKGLSNSRNKLLDNSSADICIISDDDLTYYDDYVETIEDAYVAHPDADIIVFCYTTIFGADTRVRYCNDRRMHLWNISKAASVEITFKRNAIRECGVRFNPHIGIGTQYASGEENAFLADALRAGLKIYHVPKTICAAQVWTLGDNDSQIQKYLVDKGAAFYCIYRKWFAIYAMAFIAVKKRSMFSRISFREAIKLMWQGKTEYLMSYGE